MPHTIQPIRPPLHAAQLKMPPTNILPNATHFEKLSRKDYSERTVSDDSVSPSTFGLDKHGLGNQRCEHWNLPTAALYEHAIINGEAQMASGGPLVVRTGRHTGRAAKDKFFVDEPSSRDSIAWGDVNQRMTETTFDWLRRKATAYMQNRTVYVMDVFVGQDKEYRLPVRVITETAWHALFVRTMFIRPTDEELATHIPKFTVLHVPGMLTDPATDGVNSSTVIALNMGTGLSIIAGTFYAGEIKKCAFTAMNYYLPKQGVLSMHAAANIGEKGDTAIFFGLSGTGKTTLSTDPKRQLIGDDEHGWSEKGVFNIEGGCYAKVIKLDQESEPVIWKTTRSFGTILENTIMDPVTRQLDLSDGSITENTRAAYPLHCIPNFKEDAQGGIPKNIFMLTCDAFGVLPPISRLTPAQAELMFLLGYTAKVAGTEQGVTKPSATFSTCFGLPFMPLQPTVYSKMLREKLLKDNVNVWLINTGWSGGVYGVGKRFSIKHTRALLDAALEGVLDGAQFAEHPVFKLHMPTSCPNVPAEVLDPRTTWADKDAYDAQCKELAALMNKAFKKFEGSVSDDVKACLPENA